MTDDNRKSTERAKNPTGALKLQGMVNLQRQLVVTNKGIVNLKTVTDRRLHALNRDIHTEGVETRKELRALRQSFERYAKDMREHARQQRRAERQEHKLSIPKHVRDTYTSKQPLRSLRDERERAASRTNHHSMSQLRDERGRFMKADGGSAGGGGGGGLLGMLGAAAGVGGDLMLLEGLKRFKNKLLGRTPKVNNIAAEAVKDAERAAAKEAIKDGEKALAKEVAKDAEKAVAKEVVKDAAEAAVANEVAAAGAGVMAGGGLLAGGVAAATVAGLGASAAGAVSVLNSKHEGEFGHHNMTMGEFFHSLITGKTDVEETPEEKQRDDAIAKANQERIQKQIEENRAKAAQDTAEKVGAVYVKALDDVAAKSLAVIEDKTKDTQKSLVDSFNEVKQAEDRKETQDRIIKALDPVSRNKSGVGGSSKFTGAGQGDGGPELPSPDGSTTPRGGGDNNLPSPSGAGGAPPAVNAVPRTDTQVDNSSAPGAPDSPQFNFGRNVKPSAMLGSDAKPGFGAGMDFSMPKPASASAPSGANYDFGGSVSGAAAAPVARTKTLQQDLQYGFGRNVRTPASPLTASPDASVEPVSAGASLDPKLNTKDMLDAARSTVNSLKAAGSSIFNASRAFGATMQRSQKATLPPASTATPDGSDRGKTTPGNENKGGSTPGKSDNSSATPGKTSGGAPPAMPAAVTPNKPDNSSSGGGGDDDEDKSDDKSDDGGDDKKGKGKGSGSSVSKHGSGEVTPAATPDKSDDGGGDNSGDKTDTNPSAAPDSQQREVAFTDIPSQTDDYMLAAMHSTDTV